MILILYVESLNLFYYYFALYRSNFALYFPVLTSIFSISHFCIISIVFHFPLQLNFLLKLGICRDGQNLSEMRTVFCETRQFLGDIKPPACTESLLGCAERGRACRA